MSKADRAFTLITADFHHPKYGDTYKVALLNRKMLMPAKYMTWQGKVALFGGKIEDRESSAECARRELAEELSLDISLDSFKNPERLGPWDIFFIHLHEDFNQKVMTTLSGQCSEGLLDVFDVNRTHLTSDSEFIHPVLKQIVLDKLKQ